MLSLAEQSAIARDLEMRYNAELRGGAVPGVASVTFYVPSPGALEVRLKLAGLTASSPYTCDENDTANAAS